MHTCKLVTSVESVCNYLLHTSSSLSLRYSSTSSYVQQFPLKFDSVDDEVDFVALMDVLQFGTCACEIWACVCWVQMWCILVQYVHMGAWVACSGLVFVEVLIPVRFSCRQWIQNCVAQIIRKSKS